jgi:hypothetical protein
VGFKFLFLVSIRLKIVATQKSHFATESQRRNRSREQPFVLRFSLVHIEREFSLFAENEKREISITRQQKFHFAIKLFYGRNLHFDKLPTSVFVGMA